MDKHSKPSNKKRYITPELVTYGTVVDITQAFGPSSTQDFVLIGGSNVSNPIQSTGSRNGIIVPY
jgi:hypothetical protein